MSGSRYPVGGAAPGVNCRGKVAWREPRDAEAAAKRQRRECGAVLVPYRCACCHRFHTGERGPAASVRQPSRREILTALRADSQFD